MNLFTGTIADFRRRLREGVLIPMMTAAFEESMLAAAGSSEIASWTNSLPALESAIPPELNDAAVLLEYMLPLTSKRIDVLLLANDDLGRPTASVIELKQWGEATLDEGTAIVEVGNRRLLHPQQQVAQYVQYLEDFHSMVQDDGLRVAGCAYLHNATKQTVATLSGSDFEHLKRFPFFTGDEVPEFVQWL